MKTIAEAVADAAESKVGIAEAGGNNKGAELQPFFDADNYDPNGGRPGDNGYAWCASFICWCCMVALAGRKISFKRPTTPSAWGMESWSMAQDRSTWTLKSPGLDISRGDIVVFKISHVGIAAGSPDGNGYFQTVEGNTSGSSGGNQRDGDGVYRKRRHISEIRSRIRFR